MKPALEDYYLTVTPRRGPVAGDIRFALANEANRNQVDYLKEDGTLDFSTAKKKYFRIHFKLLEAKAFGLKFLNDLQDAIWITDGSSCPTKRPQKQLDEFDQRALTPDGMTLSIVNKNKTKKRYGYTLRFAVEGSKEVEEFDPVVVSGGGGGFEGGGDGDWWPRAAVVAGVAAGAALLFALAKRVTRDRDGRQF